MDYFLKGAGEKVLDARVTVDHGVVTLHSRSGKPRSAPPGTRGRNPDYVAAFDAIFDRLNIPDAVIERVLLDSTHALQVPEGERLLASRAEVEAKPLDEVKTLVRARMRAFGRSKEMPPNEGNQNKKIRIDTTITDAQLRSRLRVVTAPSQLGPPATQSKAPSVEQPLPAEQLRKVKPVHVLAALARLDAGELAENFGESQQYDAKTDDGRAYAPKKVFGLALEEAFSIEAKPVHFVAGWGTPCFDILEQSGLWIVPKPGTVSHRTTTSTEIAEATNSLIPTEEERKWIEGNPKIAVHLQKERQPGLAAAKRAQFIQLNGKLFCEKCHLEPGELYGPDAGVACIEVHHHRTHVADMGADHETSLDDLRCLCANCHRVLHRSLSLGLDFSLPGDN